MLYQDPVVSATLETELAAYRAQLKSFSAEHEGEYVVLQGVKPLGFYPSYEAALEAGYKKYGLDPFLVKLICLHEEPGFLPVCIPSHAEYQTFEGHSFPARGVAARGGK